MKRIREFARDLFGVQELRALAKLGHELRYIVSQLSTILRRLAPRELNQLVTRTIVSTLVMIALFRTLPFFGDMFRSAMNGGTTGNYALVMSGMLGVYATLFMLTLVLERYGDLAMAHVQGELKKYMVKYFPRIRTELGVPSFDGDTPEFKAIDKASPGSYHAKFVIPAITGAIRAVLQAGANFILIALHMWQAGAILAVGLTISTLIELHAAVRRAKDEEATWRDAGLATDFGRGFETRERFIAYDALNLNVVVMSEMERLTAAIAEQERLSELEQLRLEKRSWAILSLTLVVLGALIVRETRSQQLAFGEFFMLLYVIPVAIRSFKNAATNIARIALGSGALGTMFRYMESRQDGSSTESVGVSYPFDASPELEIRSLTFRRRPDDPPALNGMHLKISGGEQVTLCATSGGGKTTLFHILAGRLKPAPGMVFLGGVDVASIKRADLRRAIVCMPQDPVRPLGSVKLMHAFAGGQLDPEKVPDADVIEALKRATLYPVIERWKDGLRARLSTNDASRNGLSGGEQRRLNLSLVIYQLLHNPEVRFACLDEPFEGMDATLSAEVEHFVRLVCKRRGITLIFSNHHTREIDADSDVVFFTAPRPDTLVYRGKRAKLDETCEPFRAYTDRTILGKKVDPDERVETQLPVSEVGAH